LITELEVVTGQRHASAALNPGKHPVPIVEEVGWAPGPVWTDAENLPPPGFDPRNVHPVASRYTDYATLPTPPFNAKFKEREQLYFTPLWAFVTCYRVNYTFTFTYLLHGAESFLRS